MDIYLRIHSYFRLSRFRTAWLGNIRGPHRFPDNFDKFYDTFTSHEVNSFSQMTKEKINEVFKDEIKENSAEMDSQGLFPKWEDSKSFLQYCYFDIDIEIPEDILIAKPREDLVDMFKNLLSQIRSTMLELSAIGK